MFNIESTNSCIPARDVLKSLDSKVIGQKEAKLAIFCAIRNHSLALADNDRARAVGRHIPLNYKPFGSQTTLLVGPSGAGKSHIIEMAAAAFDKPFIHIDSAGIVPNGIVGQSPDDLYSAGFQRFNADPHIVGRSVVFLDEFDKLIRNSVHPDAVAPFLRHLEGTTIQVSEDGSSSGKKIALDTGEMLYLLGGAFVGLSDVIAKRLGKSRSKAGFVSGTKDLQNEADLLCKLTHEDLIEYGMMRELVGRIGSFAVLHPLTIQELRQILTDVDDSVVSQKKRLYKYYDVDLVFTEQSLQYIAEQASAINLGARGLASCINKLFSDIGISDPEVAYGSNVKRILIDVEGNKPVKKIFYRSSSITKGTPLADKLLSSSPISEDLDIQSELDRSLPADTIAETQSLSQCLNLLRMQGYSDQELLAELKDVFAHLSKGKKMTDDQVIQRINHLEVQLDFPLLTGTPRKWWSDFKAENSHRMQIVLRLAEELLNRKATINEFFLSYVYSNTENIQANLFYLDYSRIRNKERERRKKEAEKNKS